MTKRQIKQFQDEYRFLSNFYPVTITYDSFLFPTVEHAYQYAKFDNEEIQDEIRAAHSPGEAKRIANRYKNFISPIFRIGKRSLMLHLCREKFNPANEDLCNKLLATYPAELIEGNYWNDRYWGVDLRTNQGENHLGKILMQIREELRNALGVK